jgi:hypothetical protein
VNRGTDTGRNRVKCGGRDREEDKRRDRGSSRGRYGEKGRMQKKI